MAEDDSMALPKEYVAYKEYFTKALSFLNENDYIFNFANTDILLNDILKNFASKWREYLEIVRSNEIIKLSEDKMKSKSPTSPSCHFSNQFDKFNENLRRLQPSMNSFKCDNDDSSVKQKPLNGLSPKKQHEIFKLSDLIHDHCKHKNITLIVDIGSGLGYLSQLMFEKYGYSVLGIESDEIRLASALKRQEKYHKSSVKNVKYVRHFVTAQSENTLMELVKENFDKCDRFCLVGLHACADLAVNAIKLFLRIQECKSLIIMPCCYHKMTFITNFEGKLNENFNQCFNHTDNDKCSVECMQSSNCQDGHNSADTSNKISKEKIFDDCSSKTKIGHELLDIEIKQAERKAIEMSTDAVDNHGFIFENFPMSKALKTSYRKLNAGMLLRRPFLRLACQRVQAGWNEHGDEEKDCARVFHLMSRAVLQLYALKENANLVKIKRRAVRKIQSKKCDFESFLDDAINRGYILEILPEANKIPKDITDPDKHLCYLNSTSNNSKDFSQRLTKELHSEYSEKNNATGNCTDSIAKNKNVFAQHGTEEEPLQKEERKKTTEREDISIGKRNEACLTFEALEMFNNKVVLENNNYLEFDKCKILALWNDLRSIDFNAAALLLELQDALQGLCENLVLLDKIAFLHERNEEIGGLQFEFLKVTNDRLSPRCHALVAQK